MTTLEEVGNIITEAYETMVGWNEQLIARKAVLVAELEKIDAALELFKAANIPARPALNGSGSSTSSEAAKPEAKTTKAPPTPKASDGPGSRRKWSDEEKADAVDRVKELGSTSSAAEELGIHPTMITRWKREGFGGGGLRDKRGPTRTLPDAEAIELREGAR